MQLEFEDDGEGKEYKVETVYNKAVYAKELESSHFPGFYYLIS